MKPLTTSTNFLKIPKTNGDRAAERAHVINETIQRTLHLQEQKDRRFRFWGYFSLTIVLIVGVLGIYQQNNIASQNKQHLDCIVKLFATPTPPFARTKFIQNASTQCNIKFTQ